MNSKNSATGTLGYFFSIAPQQRTTLDRLQQGDICKKQETNTVVAGCYDWLKTTLPGQSEKHVMIPCLLKLATKKVTDHASVAPLAGYALTHVLQLHCG